MQDWEGSYTSGGGETPTLTPLPRRRFSLGSKLSVLGVGILAVGLFAAIIGSQQSTEQRSRAAYTTPYRANTPLAGETWKQGTTHVITWVSESLGEKVSISIVDVPQWKSYSVIATAVGTGSYTWTIPADIPSSEYLIYIECISCSGTIRQYGYGNKFFISGGYTSPTPTSIRTPTPTRVPTPTILPTGLPTPTSTGAIPTATPNPTATSVSLKLALNGIGGAGNTSPLHPQRTAVVDVYNAQNQLVTTKQGFVAYQASSGKFVGTVELGAGIATGAYSVKVKVGQYLRSLVPGIQNLTQSKVNALPDAALISGDIKGDNIINIVDYSILMGCYSDLLPPTDCSVDNARLSDLTDDGKTNQFDYNLFLRELSAIPGQ